MKKQKESEVTVEEIYIRSLFSRNLRQLRENAKMSQLELADEANLTHNFISDIENGKKWISPETLAKLVIALNADPHHFFSAEPKYVDKGAELFLNDISDSFDKLLVEYRSRLVPAEDKTTDDDKKRIRKQQPDP